MRYSGFRNACATLDRRFDTTPRTEEERRSNSDDNRRARKRAKRQRSAAREYYTRGKRSGWSATHVITYKEIDDDEDDKKRVHVRRRISEFAGGFRTCRVSKRRCRSRLFLTRERRRLVLGKWNQLRYFPPSSCFPWLWSLTPKNETCLLFVTQ